MATVLVRHTTKYNKRSGRSSIIKYRGVIQKIKHFINPTQCVTITGDIWTVKPTTHKHHNGERMADYVSVR